MKKVAVFLLTLAIPMMLFAGVWQTARYTRIERELLALEREQAELVTMNRRLISGISVLSSPERIEKVAILELGMRKAEPSEITRIALKKGDLGG